MRISRADEWRTEHAVRFCYGLASDTCRLINQEAEVAS